jgi:hypothetical protein
MPNIRISVQNKIAKHTGKGIVCGNNDYTVTFRFDSEWDAHPRKTARFIWNDAYYDVEFSGDTCPMPLIKQAHEVEVGVYVGALRTTTPAIIHCRPSVRSDDTLPAAPEAVEEYNNQAQAAAAEARAAAIAATQTAEAVERSLDSLTGTANAALTLAQDNGAAIGALGQGTADAVAHAAALDEHARSTRVRDIFTVGAESEQGYLDSRSTGIYSVSGRYRYNNYPAVTIYRYALESASDITSAIWHAHLAQQTLLEASVDGEHWVTLLDTQGKAIGTQTHYQLCKVLPLTKATQLFVRIGDSGKEDGLGGAILSDVPVTLDVTYGTTLPYALPHVSEEDDGRVLRVVGGRWVASDATALVSRVRTYSFTVGEADESRYLMPESTSYTNATCRFCDGSRFMIYRYRIANAALVRQISWTANIGQQYRLECSQDGVNWTLVEDAGNECRAFERRTFDLTDRLNLLAFDEVYLRISDSAPSDGFGGAIQRERVDLHVERVELPIRV